MTESFRHYMRSKGSATCPAESGFLWASLLQKQKRRVPDFEQGRASLTAAIKPQMSFF